MFKENEIIWVNKEEIYDKNSCEMCSKFGNWIECESPIGHVLCSNCGWRKSKKKYKLIIDNYGYKLVDVE